MRPSSRRALLSLALTALAAPSGCGVAAPAPALPVAPPSAQVAASAAPSAFVAPPDGPMPQLRTGEIARIDHATALEGQVTASHVDAAYETLAVTFTRPPEIAGVRESGLVVALDGAAAGPYAFATSPEASSRREGAPLTVWIKRPRAERGEPVTGSIFAAYVGRDTGHRFRFHAAVGAAQKSDPDLPSRWGRALAEAIRDRGATPWHAFAAERLESVFAEKKAAAKATRAGIPARAPRTDLTELMDTTTGAMSIQEALQMDRPLLLRAAQEKPTVALAALAPPKSSPHPWDDLLKSLGKKAPAEPLAASVPAEFYYLRAADLGVLFQLSDQIDAWATPIVSALDRAAAERDLASRYETELGLARTALARALGKEVVAQIALVGSDPYLREGSDVSVLFQVKQRALFEAGLAGTLALRSSEHGGVAATTAQHEGVDVRIATSPDGAVRQHRATVGDLEIVSNSLGAMRRILATIKGKHPRLADEKDFAYLLARDADVRADALGFLGDRFVGEVIGPRQKILEARRQIALAELMTPGFAALLYGWTTGRSPASVEELVASKLLGKGELAHGGGAAITWKPGVAARSMFGTPAALTPLLDLPEPTLVTASERDAYDRFSRGYESYWRTYIDPAAIRVAVDTTAAGTTLSADLRVVPLIDGTDYREILGMAGQARVTAPAIGSGARAVIGVGQSASVRRDLARLARGFSSGHDLGLDFLGEWAMVGVDDRPAVATAVRMLERDLPEAPGVADEPRLFREIEAATGLPAYVAIGIKSMAGATIALAALHAIGDDVMPGGIQWGERGKERDVTLVRIAIKDDDDRGGGQPDAAKKGAFEIFYALSRGVFLASFNEGTLRRLVDDLVDGHGPGPAATSATGSQLVVDLAGEKQGALFTVLSWLLTEESIDAGSSRAVAEALLVGARDRASDPRALRALGLAYWGSVPVPPEGGAFTLAADGVHDPRRGSASAPVWPKGPVAGGPVDKLLSAVGRFRSEIAFDREGPGKGDGELLSLHAKVTLGLRSE